MSTSYKYHDKRSKRSRERSPRRDYRSTRSPSIDYPRKRRSPSITNDLRSFAKMPPLPTSQPISEYDQEYFFRMSRRIKDEFRDETDKELFTKNLYQQIQGREISLSYNKNVSICIQWLIENCTNPEEIRQLTEIFPVKKVNLEFVTNQFSSHVVQSLIEGCLKVLSRECTLDYGQRHFKWSLNYILDISEFICLNFDTIFYDPYGYHIVTTVLEASGGIRIGRQRNRKAMGFGKQVNIYTDIEQDLVIKELPSLLKSTLKRLANTVLDRDDKQVKELINSKSTSFVQYLLFILKLRINDLCQQKVKKLVELIFSGQDDKVAAVSNSNIAYLVESIILVCSEHRLKRIWEKHFRGNLRAMYCDDIANFIVQRIIDAVSTEQLYQEISSELLPHLASIFLLNRPGIGVCLAKSVLKFPNLQQEFIYAIMKAFHCYEPKEKQLQLIPSMLFSENTMITSNQKQQLNPNNNKNGQCWLHASLILQYMFQFKDPKRLYKSLLSLEPREIVSICNDASGSHCIDSFLKSNTVPEKAIVDFLNHLEGRFIDLACNKYGSRVIDNILSSVNIKLKQQILDEFAAHESVLQSNKIGFYLSKNVGLYHFKYRHNEWRDFEIEKERKRKMFNSLTHELIDDRRSTEKSDEHTHRSSNSHSHQVNSLSNHDQHSNSSHSYNSRAFSSHDNGHQSQFKKPRYNSNYR